MVSPNAVFTELVTTTFRKHEKELKDNVSRNTALLRRLRKMGKFRKEDGGLSIAIPLEYAENTTYQRYSGYDVLNVSQSDVMTAAEYQWRQIAVNVVASGRELRINSGAERILNLSKSRLKNAMNTFNNNFSFDLYSDGSLANQINGLQAIIPDSGLNTIGGINGNSWTFWRPWVQSAAAPIQGGSGVVVGPATIESLLLGLYLALVRGADEPDMCVASNDYFQFFEQSQTSQKRYTGEDADAGFVSMKYKNMDVIFDGNSGIPQSHLYMLNTDYFEMVEHTDAAMTVNEEVKPYNQDAVVIPVLWMGNLVCSNRFLQGVVHS